MGWVVNATPRPLYPRERSSTHCIGGWEGPRTVLDSAENLAPTGIPFPNHPAPSELLYRLRYPGPQHIASFKIKQDKQCTHNATQARSRDHCCGKAKSITYTTFASVAFVVDYAQRMRLSMFICSFSGSTIFFALSHKRHDFRKYVIESTMCVFIFYKFYPTHLSF
jgi:hypothetical protein